MMLSKKFPWNSILHRRKEAPAIAGQEREGGGGNENEIEEKKKEEEENNNKKKIHMVFSSKVLSLPLRRKAAAKPRIKPKSPRRPREEEVADHAKDEGATIIEVVAPEDGEEADLGGGGAEGDVDEAVLCDVCGKPKPISRCFFDAVGCPHVFCLHCLGVHVGHDASDDRWPADGAAACPVPGCIDGFLRLAPPDGPPTFFCAICMERKPLAECFFGVHRCDHAFCMDCIGLYVAAKVGENSVTIRCPDPECRHGWLSLEACQQVIPPAVFDRWGMALCESAVSVPARFYCPYKDCSAMLVKEEDGGEGEERMTESQCLHCKRLCCAQCRVPWHKGQTCEAYQKSVEEEEEVKGLKKLAKDSQWQRCGKCGFYVERIDGCVFIICRCGHSFCYRCASPMDRKDKKHYCNKCGMTWDRVKKSHQ